MLNAMEVSAGMKMNRYLNLRLVAEMNGHCIVGKRRKRYYVFPAIYYCRLQPEVSMGNSFSITATAGVSCSRIAYYTTRTLKLSSKICLKILNPYFKPAMYVSVG
jgi:hypothetical protein